MQYRAVLFDLDGTLLDTLEDLADSINAVLIRLGFPVYGPDDYRTFIGDGVELLARRALPEDRRDDAMVSLIVAEGRREYGRRWADKTRVYEGIEGLLDTLTGRGIRMAVLSNKPDDFTGMMVSHYLPRWQFDAVWGARVDVPKKPDPGAALAIASLLRVPPSQFLYLGDTDTDMRTARSAGMFPVGALWGFRTGDELIKNGARALIDRPGDLLGLL